MDTPLKMDVYSSHWVPFTVAAYCRGRKFAPESVNLAKALRQQEDARLGVLAAEKLLDEAEERVRSCVKAAEARMEREGQA